ncbi:hypothetical protein C8R44DRAFT_869677 [Mycena epipterygia]|nr:hypothetical protein C8R44DRAFT_869677 [Mycena epipterygia]
MLLQGRLQSTLLIYGHLLQSPHNIASRRSGLLVITPSASSVLGLVLAMATTRNARSRFSARRAARDRATPRTLRRQSPLHRVLHPRLPLRRPRPLVKQACVPAAVRRRSSTLQRGVRVHRPPRRPAQASVDLVSYKQTL